MIRENMVLDKKERRLHFRYPLIKDPSVLTDNRRQAISMAEGLERRLRKSGDLEIYNKALQEFLDRDCIVPISDEEMANCRGIINYISHGVPKPGSTTPLRIVSNSSLNNNISGHSYNGYLAKGSYNLEDFSQMSHLRHPQSLQFCLYWWG